MLTYGIDPGLSGAVSVALDGVVRDVRDMPTVQTSAGTVRRQVDPAGLAAVIREWRAAYGVDAEWAVIERVAARPGQGVASVFSFGHSAGCAAGVIAALGIPHELAAPQTWKRAFALGRDKSEARAVASRLCPQLAGQWARVRDDGRAEAALMAIYGWRATH